MAHRDTAGQLVIGANVVNRPWEWIENLGEAPSSESVDERNGQGYLKGKEPVKNTASLSLLTFGARTTGDTIMARIPDSDARLQSSIRTFEDSLSYEPVFTRDWRESRLELSDDLMKSGNGTRTKGDLAYESKSSPVTQGRGDHRVTPRGSPVSTSSHSRGSVASMRQSPAHRMSSTSGAPEIIDVDAFSGPSNSGVKRKGADDSDDDIIIVEGPSTAKNKRAKAPPKKAGKRR
jgi:mediator of RNA polymerase II transcription subunit 12, fungi type